MEPRREFALIEMLEKIFAPSSGKVKLGIGDDAAVVDCLPGNKVLSTDTLVEDVHFNRAFHPPGWLGNKAIAVNVSDINAMGGVAEFALLAMAIPPAMGDDYLKKIGQGIAEGCRQYGLEIIGGDITRSPGPFFINIMIWGSVINYITRSGAKVGDDIWVTGFLGDSYAGWLWLSEEANKNQLDLILKEVKENGLNERINFLLKAHLKPQVSSKAGPLLAPLVRSMIDISDGLANDIGHICTRSNVGASINLDSLPLSPALKWWAKNRGKDPRQLALVGGEDYQLLFSAPPEKEMEIRSILDFLKLKCSRIGKIKEKARGVKVFDQKGCQHLEVEGWNHFA